MSEVFDNARFWPAFEAAGLLRLVTVKSGGALVDVRVGYVEPDRARLGGAGLSRDYEIEYRKADLPKLKEGVTLTLWSDDDKTTGTKFRVRQPPFTPEAPVEGIDGYFCRAILTMVK